MSIPQNYASTVNSLYLAFYGRPADPAGLKFWATQLANNDGDVAPIIGAFATSEEAQVRFGTDTVSERIAEIYAQLFNRAPDAEGLAFYTRAIEQGQASLADVSVAILNGARDSDKTLSELRQKAADAFTAQVEASGTEYSGYASIEAARVLVRAVTPDATQDDLDVLVQSAVSFADTATKTPQVVEAIAVNTTLLALFDTQRGVKEPVALAKALADTAKAAAGDPATLESLLRGGGMDKVLKVMPSRATLQDVVDALAEGGLPAAVEVVYPTKPSIPGAPSAPAFKIVFDSVQQGEGDTRPDDTVTSKASPVVKFSYTGNDLGAGQHFEYTTNGNDWIRTGIVEDRVNNIVTIEALDLGGGMPVGGAGQTDVQAMITPMASGHMPDLVTRVMMRAVEGSKVLDSAWTDIVHDRYVPTPSVWLVNDTAGAHAGTVHDKVTKDGAFEVFGLEAGARVEYQHTVVQELPPAAQPGALPDMIVSMSVGSGVVGSPWSSTRPVAMEGLNTIRVRQTDAAGNRSESEFTFRLDKTAPTAPTVGFAYDLDPTLGAANDGRVLIGGLETVQGSGWEYSVDGGNNWTFGGLNGVGAAQLNLAEQDLASGTLAVRQVDAAGNVGAASAPKAFTIDAPPPAPAMTTSYDAAGVHVHSTHPGSVDLVSRYENDTRTEAGGNTNPDGEAIVGARSIYYGVSLDVHSEYGTPGGAIDIATVRADWEGENVEENSRNHLVVSVTPDGGAPLADASARVYHLGSNDDHIMFGQYVWGFGGNDVLIGTSEADFLSGGAGNDVLYGGVGADVLSGGTGNDIFAFGKGSESVYLGQAGAPVAGNAPASGGSFDAIQDFTAGIDRIQLDAGVVRHPDRGITIDTTAHASVAEMVARIGQYFADPETHRSLFAAQVGDDVYLLADGAGTDGVARFDEGQDLFVRLEKVRVQDLRIGDFIGLGGSIRYVGDHSALRDVAAPDVGTVTLSAVTQGEGDLSTSDNVTSRTQVDVTFSYTGAGLRSGEGFEYSTDGQNWTSAGLSLDAVNKTVRVPALDLSGGAPISDGTHQGDLGTLVHLRAVNQFGMEVRGFGNVVLDQHIGATTFTFETVGGADTAGAQHVTGLPRADVRFSYDRVDPDATFQYRIGDGEWNGSDLAWDRDAHILTVKGVDLSAADPDVQVRVLDMAGNIGNVGNQVIDGPYTATPPVQSEPYFTVTRHADGLQLATNVTGAIKLNGTAVTSKDGGANQPGTSTLGVQASIMTGKLAIELQDGSSLTDPADRVYTLGTDVAQSLSGANLWGFGGDDMLMGTAGDDFLVGGTGADRHLLFQNGNDTVVIGNGDTAVDVVADGNTVDISRMDKIVTASAGDVFQIGPVFTSGPAVQSSFLVDASINHYAVVRGSVTNNSFIIGQLPPDPNMTAYLLQWSDGQHVHSVVLQSMGEQAPQFAVDIGAGTMTVEVVGVPST